MWIPEFYDRVFLVRNPSFFPSRVTLNLIAIETITRYINNNVSGCHNLFATSKDVGGHQCRSQISGAKLRGQNNTTGVQVEDPIMAAPSITDHLRHVRGRSGTSHTRIMIMIEILSHATMGAMSTGYRTARQQLRAAENFKIYAGSTRGSMLTPIYPKHISPKDPGAQPPIRIKSASDSPACTSHTLEVPERWNNERILGSSDEGSPAGMISNFIPRRKRHATCPRIL